MTKRKLNQSQKQWQVKKLLISFFLFLFLAFLLLGFLLNYFVTNYSSWLITPTVIIFTGQTKSDQQSTALIMNVQADLSESQLVLLSGSLADFTSSRQFATKFGILSDEIVRPNQSYLDQDDGKLSSWLWVGVFQQIKHFDFNVRYTLLALKLLSSVGTEVIKQDSLSQDFLKLNLQNEIKPLISAGAKCPIAVSNAADKAGLATEVANFLVNQGGVVVRVTNYGQVLHETEVVVDELSQDCLSVARLLGNSLSDSRNFKLVPKLFSQSRSQIEVRIAE